MLTPFHVGIVVADLAIAMRTLSLTGLKWAGLRTETRSVWTPSGDQHITFIGTFSTSETMHLELIRDVPGSLWSGSDRLHGFHHIGFWCDDIAADTASLVDQGLSVAAAGGSPAAPEHFVYFGLPDGGYLELVDASARPEFETWWAEK